MVSDFYWPFLGGVEQHVRSLSHSLAERGHQVSVATLWNQGLAEEEIDQNVKIYRLHSSTQRATWLHSEPKRPWAPPFPDPEITLGLRAVIQRERPQLVHGHDWLARSFLPLKRWSDAKLVMTLHYYTSSCAKKNLMFGDAPCSGPALNKCLTCAGQHYGRAKGIAATLANWGMNAVEQRAVDTYVAVSRATAKGNGLSPDGASMRIIPNFLPAARLDGAHNGDSSKMDDYLSKLPQGDFMLFVGDLRPIKGLDVLLKAYSALVDAPPLVLIGKVWPDTPTQLPPNTHLLASWPNDAVMEAWRRSAIALVPSVWPEPFGIVVIEAMAGATPVIASSIGGIPEIVSDGVNGFLVEPGDCEALRVAMEKLINDVDLRHRMGCAAKERSADFSASAVVPRIEALYESLVLQNLSSTIPASISD